MLGNLQARSPLLVWSAATYGFHPGPVTSMFLRHFQSNLATAKLIFSLPVLSFLVCSSSQWKHHYLPRWPNQKPRNLPSCPLSLVDLVSFNVSLKLVLDSWSPQDKWSQTVWLKQQTCIFSHFRSLGTQNEGVSKAGSSGSSDGACCMLLS